MTGDPLVPLVRPEIIESFGSWMIADRRNRRPSKRMVMEEKKGNGKGGDSAVNLGKNSRSATDSQLMVSTRYNALMARDEDSEDFRAGDNGSMQNKEINAGGSAVDAQIGRPLGQRKQRANSGPRDQRRAESPHEARAEKSPHDIRAEKSPQDTRAEKSPHDTRAEKNSKDTRAEKRLAVARAEKRPVTENNSTANSKPESSKDGELCKRQRENSGARHGNKEAKNQ